MYNIFVKTLQDKVLVFKGINSYKVEDGFVIFRDHKKNKIRRFAVSNVEIDEEDDING